MPPLCDASFRGTHSLPGEIHQNASGELITNRRRPRGVVDIPPGSRPFSVHTGSPPGKRSGQQRRSNQGRPVSREHPLRRRDSSAKGKLVQVLSGSRPAKLGDGMLHRLLHLTLDSGRVVLFFASLQLLPQTWQGANNLCTRSRDAPRDRVHLADRSCELGGDHCMVSDVHSLDVDVDAFHGNHVRQDPVAVAYAK